MRRTVSLAATAAISLCAITLPAACSEPGTAVVDGEGILGTYTVNGVDARGEEYSGTVVIEATDISNEYLVQWLVTGAIQEGIGELRGNDFTVRWSTVSSAGGEASGSASYTLTEEGDFEGTRTIDGVEGVGTETIFQEA